MGGRHAEIRSCLHQPILARHFGRAIHSAELKVFASRAVWTVLREVGQEFEQKTGHKLVLTTGLSFHYVDQFNAGEFDVVAAPPPELDRLIKATNSLHRPKLTLLDLLSE
jgi:ABC-type molybdate transport system substrate-binding protein